MSSVAPPRTGEHLEPVALRPAGHSVSGPRSARAAGERILLIRSGRHLRVAVDALQERFPGCTIAVVGTPGSEPVIAQAGIAPARIFIYGAKPRFTPVAFALSRAALAARRWGYTRVAVLWNDPDGRGQGNVDRTAFVLAPRGFLAVTPDGSVAERSPFRQLGYEVRRALTSLSVGVVLGALYAPAIVVATARRVRFARPALQDSHVGRAPRPSTRAQGVPSNVEGRSGPAGTVGDDSACARHDTRPTYGIVTADTKGKAA